MYYVALPVIPLLVFWVVLCTIDGLLASVPCRDVVEGSEEAKRLNTLLRKIEGEPYV